MWKKAYIALILANLALIPASAMAQVFDPFEGITVGIAQGMSVGGNLELDSYVDDEAVQGGNVVIGDGSLETAQGATIDGNAGLTMEYGTDNVQGLNVLQGKIAVLALQGAAIGEDVIIDSRYNDSSVQGVNVVYDTSP